MNKIYINWLGQIDYDDAWDLQKAMVAQRQKDAALTDALVLLEHPPTYTLGRRGSLKNLLISEEALTEGKFSLRWVDRGGDITYHGPGQLVGYPILNLKRLFQRQGKQRPDLHQYLRNLEEVLIQTCAEFGLKCWRYEGYTGVWLDTDDGPKKIAAIGVKVSAGGISSHGFALNVCPNLDHFDHIIPCGIKEHGVTSMMAELQRPLTPIDILKTIMLAFCNVFQYQPQIKTENTENYEHY